VSRYIIGRKLESSVEEEDDNRRQWCGRYAECSKIEMKRATYSPFTTAIDASVWTIMHHILGSN
jgi:hypothetical protein